MVAAPKPTPIVKEPKRLKGQPRAIPRDVRLAVFARDLMTCQWCEVPGGALDAHHIVRRSQGGKDVVNNLTSVHRVCHRFIHEHPTAAKARGFLA
jgi:5-methylcytosine-specific restriction endonuclease McrA